MRLMATLTTALLASTLFATAAPAQPEGQAVLRDEAFEYPAFLPG